MKNTYSLADLDELLLSCRDQRTKTLLFEAIASYKVGAYRSAIVSTWVAVCFDFIEKLHELSLSGDKQAEQLSKDVTDARLRGDLSWSLKFEKTLLESARDKFELISHLEFVDLDRLQQDRNRCAHPSLASDGEPFIPSAELARLHIRSAVTSFLQHPPVQGKVALERLIEDVESTYFPTDSKKAFITISNGPLKKPRKSLISNFLVVLIKRAIDKEYDWQRRMRVISALQATRKIHETTFNEILGEKISPIFRNVKDQDLEFALYLISDIPELWLLIEQDLQLRFQLYIENLPKSDLHVLESIEDFSPLKSFVNRRLSVASIEDLQNATWFSPPKPAIQRLVDLYLISKSFDQANIIAKELRLVAPSITLDQISKIIIAASHNLNISSSFGFPALLTGIVRGQKIMETDLEIMLIENSLENHVPIAKG